MALTYDQEQELRDLEAQHKQLRKNINSGVLEIGQGENKTRFKNTPDMERTLATIASDIAALKAIEGTQAVQPANIAHFSPKAVS